MSSNNRDKPIVIEEGVQQGEKHIRSNGGGSALIVKAVLTRILEMSWNFGLSRKSPGTFVK